MGQQAALNHLRRNDKQCCSELDSNTDCRRKKMNELIMKFIDLQFLHGFLFRPSPFFCFRTKLHSDGSGRWRWAWHSPSRQFHSHVQSATPQNPHQSQQPAVLISAANNNTENTEQPKKPNWHMTVKHEWIHRNYSLKQHSGKNTELYFSFWQSLQFYVVVFSPFNSPAYNYKKRRTCIKKEHLVWYFLMYL